MNKNINLSVSACLLAGLLTTGCSQQQIQATPSNGAYSSGGSHNMTALDGYGGSLKDGFGSAVQSNSSSNTTSLGASQNYSDSQNLGMGDQQVQNIVRPEPIPVPIIVHKPAVHIKPMVKPVQSVKPRYRPMVKPVQSVKHRVAYSSTAKSRNIGMPPAKPGQCYAKVKTQPQFKNTVKRVQVSPAVNKRVKVRGPQYTYANKRVQVRPATHSYRHIPAQYKTISKRVLVKPAHYIWQKGKKGPVTRIDNMTGEILCRVKVPAVYKTVNHKVVARAAQRIKHTTPAVYSTVKQKKLTSPAQYRNVHQPARFVNKSYRHQISGAGYKWKPIDC